MTKIALYPISVIYGLIIWLRNRFFDWGVFTSQPIPGKSICVGNLSVGGTGKSPHIGYLISTLSKTHQIQVLSRGYGRQTKGLLAVDHLSNPKTVGDEPIMLYNEYAKQAHFVVCEKRRLGVKYLKAKHQDAIILLDDAYQHRWVKAGLQIVLTTYQHPFWQDQFLPLGKLRESATEIRRADAIVITKCPAFETFDPQLIKKELAHLNKPIFFSRYQYKPLHPLTSSIEKIDRVLLISAIADPAQIQESFPKDYQISHKIFEDHHPFSRADISEIHQFFDTFANENTVLVTTSKDWVKINLLLNETERKKYPWYLITFTLEWYEQETFNQFISNYVDTN
jgi:tetraacyldisaccharide 4'-kinase